MKGQALEVLLRRTEVVIEDLEPLLDARSLWFSSAVRRAVEIDIRYEGYIQQQMKDAEKLRRLSARQIPADLDYSTIAGLSREMREKLSRVRPRDLAMAGRIPGVTPAAVSILNVQLELRRARKVTHT